MAYEKLKQEHYRNLGGIDQFVSKYLTAETKFLNIRNYCFIVAGDMTSRPGQEHHVTLNNSTFGVFPTSLFQYERANGSSTILFDSGNTMYGLSNIPFAVDRIGTHVLFNGVTIANFTSAPLSFETINDKAYYDNGYDSRVYNGSFGIPYTWIPRYSYGLSGQFGLTFNQSLFSSTLSVTAIIASGTYIANYQNLRGNFATFSQGLYPLEQFYTNDPIPAFVGGLPVTSRAATLVARGQWVLYGFQMPANQGTSAVIPYYSNSIFGSNQLLGEGSTVYFFTLISGVTYFATAFDHYTSSSLYETDKYALANGGLDTFVTPTENFTLFNNRLFFNLRNTFTVYFSELIDVEYVKDTSFFDVGTSDNIVAMTTFQDALVIFKDEAIYELRGFQASDFEVRQVNTEYGLTGKRAFVKFEDKLWFVDADGVMEYNGTNIINVGDPIKFYFDQIDKSRVSAFHNKKRREVWFCSDNKCFVWDYFVGAWTIYDDIAIDGNVGAGVISYGATMSDVSYFKTLGASNLAFARFGDSLTSDFGNQITLIMQTRFHKRLEQTTQELWRRLYINSKNESASLAVTLSFITDYGPTVALQRTQLIDSFQERLDFGISSRSISVEFLIKSDKQVVINGYTLESRYLRSV